MRLLFTALLVCTISLSFAQKKKPEPTTGTTTAPATTTTEPAPVTKPAGPSQHMKVYQMARQYSDFRMAANALYYELADQPDNMALKDSLCVMYFAMGANMQAIVLGNEILAKDANNQRILEVVSISYQNLGAAKEALEQYEKLYALSKSAYHLYQIATIQYTLQRTYECQMSLTQLINHPDAEKEQVAITIDRGRQQQVMVKAAAYNVMGVMQKEAGNLEAARTSFNQALAVQKDFVLPQANLQLMDQEAKEKKEGPKK